MALTPRPFFFENGTVLMYFSANPCPPHWGNSVPGNNCIGVAKGGSAVGPFAVQPLPVTHPESEDAHVFRDARGSFHLLTNVNNDHARCAQGVACGGHAWSVDGVSFSNLTIGSFGPYVRFANGSSWHTAYVERPQVTMAKDGVTPLAFFVGMGRRGYYDSCTWAQRFCTGKGGEKCGPMLPPPPPPPTLVTLSLPRAGGGGSAWGATPPSRAPGAGGTRAPCSLCPAPTPQRCGGRIVWAVRALGAWRATPGQGSASTGTVMAVGGTHSLNWLTASRMVTPWPL